MRLNSVFFARLFTSLAAVLLMSIAGCGDPVAPVVTFTPANPNPTDPWDGYVTRHMGRAMGRLQFKVPPGWQISYLHDTIHPRIVISDRVEWDSPDASLIVVGMTEVKAPDGPPEVWDAAKYSPGFASLPEKEAQRQQELLDRKVVLTMRGRLGQSVTWQTTQATPPIGDWEYTWKFGVDPGPGAVNRDKQRVNRFKQFFEEHPGWPVNCFREFFIFGWGAHQQAYLHVYYKARTTVIQTMFESMIDTVDEFQFAEADVQLLGGVITKDHWDQLVKGVPNPAPTAPETPAPPAGSADPHAGGASAAAQ